MWSETVGLWTRPVSDQTRICAAEMAVRYAALSGCRKVHTWRWPAHKRKPKFFYFGCSLVRLFYCKIKKLHPITGRTDGQTDRRTDRQTDRRTDRVRRNMRPPPREEGRIISRSWYWSRSVLQVRCCVVKHGLVTLVVIMILKDTATLQVITIYNFSIVCLENHYCGDQQWRFLYT